MLIFLDIDGVMVPAQAWKRPELLKDGFFAFTPQATQVLQQLIAGGGTIVLTTSHRNNYSLEQWKEIFRLRNIEVQNIQSLPPNPEHLSRKDEIVNWCTMNGLNEDFVILDDDASLRSLPNWLKERFVECRSIGLRIEHLDQIAAMPDPELNPY